MLLTANGLRCVTGRLLMPVLGAWQAELLVDAADFAHGAIALEATGLRLVGTTQVVGTFRGAAHVVAVGGGGGLGKELPPKAWTGPQLQLVLDELLAAAGETRSSSSSAAVLERVLPRWQRLSSTAKFAIQEIADAAGASWRILDDGSLWIGFETWPETTTAVQVLTSSESKQRATLGLEAASLRPGTTLSGRRIVAVDYYFSSPGVRAEVEYGSDGADRLRAAIRKLVHQDVPIDRLTVHRAVVVAQSADLSTVDVMPDDKSLVDGTAKVPLRTPPGVTISMSKGARVHLVFEDRSPAGMVAIPSEPSNLTVWHFDGGTKSVARVDDKVSCGTAALVFNSGALITVIPDNAGATAAIAAAIAVTGNVVVDLRSTIREGATKLKA